MLVARVDELGQLAAAGSDAASELVAGALSRCLRTLGHQARAARAGFRHNLPDRPRRSQRADRVGLRSADRRENLTRINTNSEVKELLYKEEVFQPICLAPGR